MEGFSSPIMELSLSGIMTLIEGDRGMNEMNVREVGAMTDYAVKERLVVGAEGCFTY